MSGDPILNELSIQTRRILLFCGLVVVTTLLAWYSLLHWWFGYDNNLRDLWIVTRAAWPPNNNRTLQLLLAFCAVLALMGITNLYLMIALWWKKRSSLHHRRGSRLDDRRRDED